MVRGQISITDISIILWNINIFIQFTLSNPKFYTASLCMINTHRIKKKTLKQMLQFPFPQQNQTVQCLCKWVVKE